MKMISLQMIRDNDPCTSGWKKVKAANSHRGMDELFPLSDILDSNDISDTLWALRCVEGGSYIAQLFALECAKSVVHLAKDERVENLVEVTEKYLNGKATLEELRVARYAADAADADIATANATATYTEASVYHVKNIIKVLKQFIDEN